MTRTLAQHLSGLQYDDLPNEVVQIAKLCVLDTVGVAIAASSRPWSRAAHDTVGGVGGRDDASVWGTGTRSPARSAAMINATAAHGIEMDDRIPVASVHPGCFAIPAAMATTEARHGSGRDMLVALVAGYELVTRVGLTTRALRRGLHRSGHKGVWAAVAAASHGLGLTPDQTENAYGIAGSTAAGLYQYSRDPARTMVKRLHSGLGTSNGVLAAELALAGVDGPSDILEAELGYCRTYGAEAQDNRWNELTEGLGSEYRILLREVKPYASWGGGHNAIDAVASLQATHDVDPQRIESIRIGGSRRLLEAHDSKDARSILAAQYSLPFLTAVALQRGSEALMDPDALWSEETVNDPEVARLMDLTDLGVDPDLEVISLSRRTYGGARVTVAMRDGQHHEAVITDSKGTVDNPVSMDDIERKFRTLVKHKLSTRGADEVVAMTRSLEQIDDIRELGLATQVTT
jgi:2-methylcitrate dehydratase PrpD